MTVIFHKPWLSEFLLPIIILSLRFRRFYNLASLFISKSFARPHFSYLLLFDFVNFAVAASRPGPRTVCSPHGLSAYALCNGRDCTLHTDVSCVPKATPWSDKFCFEHDTRWFVNGILTLSLLHVTFPPPPLLHCNLLDWQHWILKLASLILLQKLRVLRTRARNSQFILRISIVNNQIVRDVFTTFCWIWRSVQFVKPLILKLNFYFPIQKSSLEKNSNVVSSGLHLRHSNDIANLIHHIIF